jgi:hypothetical protein
MQIQPQFLQIRPEEHVRRHHARKASFFPQLAHRDRRLPASVRAGPTNTIAKRERDGEQHHHSTHRRGGSHDHEYDVRRAQHPSAQVCSGFAFRFISRQVTRPLKVIWVSLQSLFNHSHRPDHESVPAPTDQLLQACVVG